ncbi:dienelactone hydrolase family protein [soil metagenome]
MSESLVHLIREPAGEPQGALLLNHGRGSDENDLYGLLDEIDPERRLLAVTPGAPLTDIPPGGRHWYRVPRVGYPDPATFESSYALLAGLYDGLLTERGIGWDRTVIGGFSMGSVMSYGLALGPGRATPAGLIALSGFVPTVEGWEPELEGRESLKALIHHGSNDPVIEIGFAHRAHELLSGAGIEVDFYESEAGHWLPPELAPKLREFVSERIPPAA